MCESCTLKHGERRTSTGYIRASVLCTAVPSFPLWSHRVGTTPYHKPHRGLAAGYRESEGRQMQSWHETTNRGMKSRDDQSLRATARVRPHTSRHSICESRSHHTACRGSTSSFVKVSSQASPFSLERVGELLLSSPRHPHLPFPLVDKTFRSSQSAEVNSLESAARSIMASGGKVRRGTWK